MATEIVLASGNRGKLVELAALLESLPVALRAQSEFAVNEAAETGLTFVENALIKARNATAATGRPALADDSGIAVDCLNGAPGIYSARYAGDGATDEQNLEKLLSDTGLTPDADRTCRFICIAVYLRHADDPLPIISHGVWEGRLLRAAIGENGFGYDPIFWVPDHQCSSAELPPRIKNQISHRAIAFNEMRRALLDEFNV